MSMLPLIDSALLLPCEFKKPNCPLPIQTPMGGGGAGASAHTLNAGPRASTVEPMTRNITIASPSLMSIGWRARGPRGRHALRRRNFKGLGAFREQIANF